MNRKGLIALWLKGGTGKASSLSCVDGVLYSYRTPIAVKDGEGVFLNVGKYSPTTSRQQSAVRAATEVRNVNEAFLRVLIT